LVHAHNTSRRKNGGRQLKGKRLAGLLPPIDPVDLQDFMRPPTVHSNADEAPFIYSGSKNPPERRDVMLHGSATCPCKSLTAVRERALRDRGIDRRGPRGHEWIWVRPGPNPCLGCLSPATEVLFREGATGYQCLSDWAHTRYDLQQRGQWLAPAITDRISPRMKSYNRLRCLILGFSGDNDLEHIIEGVPACETNDPLAISHARFPKAQMVVRVPVAEVPQRPIRSEQFT